MNFKEGTKAYLFEQLASPDQKGVSRWVNSSEFKGAYKSLSLGNGASWCRKESSLAKKYYIEFDKTCTKGPSIDRIRLNGFKKEEDKIGNQSIRKDIKLYYQSKRCVILGTSNPEVDHKNGLKNNKRVMNIKTQQLDDFQPLSKAANDAKRQFCKECKKTGIRYDAKKLGYPISYYYGCKYHDKTENGCIGCFWYDPIEFRKHLEFKE
mgnify:CR=1 FL=1